MIRSFLLAVALTVGLAAHAQLVPEIYKARVAFIDEFMSRFNSDEASLALDADTAGMSLPPRALSILGLFNLDDIGSKERDAMDFVHAVVADSVLLSPTDSLWRARGEVSGTLRGKPVTFTLTLKVEERGKDMQKWSIEEASGKIFELHPSATGKEFFITPDDHEVNFMSLTGITGQQHDCITNYAAADTGIAPTSVFFALVWAGDLKIRHLDTLEFIFPNVPGWIFTVRKFERETTNSGWLIDQLIRLQ